MSFIQGVGSLWLTCDLGNGILPNHIATIEATTETATVVAIGEAIASRRGVVWRKGGGVG